MALDDGIVRRVRITNPTLKLRVACVCYRDIEDSPRHEVLNFTDDVGAFSSFLGGVVAKGRAVQAVP